MPHKQLHNTHNHGQVGSPLFHLLLVVAMLSWGGSWITARWANGEPAMLTAFWRFAINALSFLPILVIRKETLGLDKKALPWVLASGLTLAIYNVLFLTALKTGEAGYGGVLVPSLNPQFAFLLGVLVLRQGSSWLTMGGLALGLGGGLLQVLGPSMAFERFLRPENILLLLAALAYAILTHLSSRAQQTMSVFRYSFWVALVASAGLLPLAWSHEPWNISAMGPGFWINTIYLALIAGTFGTTLYFEAARRVGGSRASSFAFLVPVSALVLGFVFLGEIPQWTSIVGGALSIMAVIIIQRKKSS